MEFIQDSLFGKMYQEHLAVIGEKISGLCLKNLLKSRNRTPLCLRFHKLAGHMQIVSVETDGALRTEFLTRNIGESPSAAVESTLSQILEANVPKKYYLSAKAYEGILRRAERRGKELPPMLKTALEQMQYLFQPIIVDNIGGQTEYARQSDTAPCLKATHYKNPPCITVSAGFCPEVSAKTRGVGYAEEQSPTLRAGAVPAVVYDARGNGDGQIVSTITGDHNNRIKDYTCLVVEPAVRCYDIGEARLRTPSEYIEKTPTLTARYGTGGNNVPGVVYCLQGNGIDRADTAGCNDKGWRENECYTLNTIDRPAAVQARYIVRSLTPTECARLQGFLDLWGHLNKKESFTDEEYKFWLEVRNTYARINNKAVKDYTKAQMLSWYNKLHSDSAEYKMWGNGIALPNALYVMQGIAEVVGVHHSK